MQSQQRRTNKFKPGCPHHHRLPGCPPLKWNRVHIICQAWPKLSIPCGPTKTSLPSGNSSFFLQLIRRLHIPLGFNIKPFDYPHSREAENKRPYNIAFYNSASLFSLGTSGECGFASGGQFFSFVYFVMYLYVYESIVLFASILAVLLLVSSRDPTKANVCHSLCVSCGHV